MKRETEKDEDGKSLSITPSLHPISTWKIRTETRKTTQTATSLKREVGDPPILLTDSLSLFFLTYGPKHSVRQSIRSNLLTILEPR